MDYIREFDIRLEKEMYYAGETINGHVILDTIENFKLRAIRVVLRGKAHTEWKVVVSGDRRTVKDDQYFIDDRAIIWGKENISNVPILPRGSHKFPFKFQLPESSLPCSFESRAGTIRYYIKVTIDIPYSSPPQGLKYLTIVGPHLDVMDDQYLKPMVGQAKRTTCCLCCERGPISLKTQLERSAYVCGESLRIKADIDNQTEEEARLKLKLVQYVEYYIDRGVLGVSKEVNHTILEYKGQPVPPHQRNKWDSGQNLVVSTMPPSLVGVCRLMQIYYVLKVNLEMEKSGEDLHMHFPITIATVPFRIPNSNQQPQIQYEVASDHVEGGMYIGPEFQLGQVYDGTSDGDGDVVLYRPVYLTIANPNKPQPQKQLSHASAADAATSSGNATPKNSNKVTLILPGSSKSGANGTAPPASPKDSKPPGATIPGSAKRVTIDAPKEQPKSESKEVKKYAVKTDPETNSKTRSEPTSNNSTVNVPAPSTTANTNSNTSNVIAISNTKSSTPTSQAKPVDASTKNSASITPVSKVTSTATVTLASNSSTNALVTTKVSEVPSLSSVVNSTDSKVKEISKGKKYPGRPEKKSEG